MDYMQPIKDFIGSLIFEVRVFMEMFFEIGLEVFQIIFSLEFFMYAFWGIMASLFIILGVAGLSYLVMWLF